MFSDCILREEDGYHCDKKPTDECIGCSYYYKGNLLTDFVGFLFWCSFLFVAAIVSIPLFVFSIIAEGILKLSKN